ncbi:MAG: 5'-3' exonuclease H3TH domain-containing protein [Candidatus Krumholzibacteria bacterium]|nr:5'-3' exonuclease H3TH domain-containing protein [Candidatus Krumholzibacteria bacterium]
MSSTAYLIDGMAYVFRSFFAMRSMSAPDGTTPINAVFGLGMTLQKLLNEHNPELVACCFDAGSKTFRSEIYPEYKANRGAPPEELVPQFDLCRELVASMGIATSTCPGFEADDVMATLTDRLLAAGHEVVIVTGDKDMAQMLQPGVRIYNLAKDDWWTAESIPSRMGVRADQVRDFLALKGDAADNIPGVRGVGDKAATALLGAFEDLDAIYADLDKVETLDLRGAKSLRGKLETDHENALLSRRLAELDRAAPCDLDAAAMKYTGADSLVLEAFATKWGLGRVAAKVPRR